MGRPADAPNKNKRGMKQRLREVYGEDFDVIMMMGKNCKQLFDMIPEEPTKEDIDTIIDANTQLDKLAQYVEPKLKAIELSGNVDGRTTLIIKDLTGADPRD